jgi:NAD(P)-dependent dehydrogenase (short-subunit alcohol dehydrogenase family)
LPSQRDIALLAHSRADLEATAQEIGACARTLVVPVDLAVPESFAPVKQRIETELGRPSILVNAAGVFGPIDLVKDTDPAAWIETIMINSIAPYVTCRVFVAGMIASGWGRIINVTSAAVLHKPGPANSAYATSKAALNQFTRHLAAELNGTGVTANVIPPGDVKTDMWAYIKDASARLGPLAEAYMQWAEWVESTGGDDPEKAADLVANLMSDDAAGVNGRFLWIEGGLQDPIPSWEDAGGIQPWRK